jgi:hypothetical protein
MDYKTFINIRRPIIRTCLIGGTYQIFRNFCDQKLLDYENGDTTYEGFEFVWVGCDDDGRSYLGMLFDDYDFLPKTIHSEVIDQIIWYVKTHERLGRT